MSSQNRQKQLKPQLIDSKAWPCILYLINCFQVFVNHWCPQSRQNSDRFLDFYYTAVLIGGLVYLVLHPAFEYFFIHYIQPALIYTVAIRVFCFWLNFKDATVDFYSDCLEVNNSAFSSNVLSYPCEFSYVKHKYYQQKKYLWNAYTVLAKSKAGGCVVCHIDNESDVRICVDRLNAVADNFNQEANL